MIMNSVSSPYRVRRVPHCLTGFQRGAGKGQPSWPEITHPSVYALLFNYGHSSKGTYKRSNAAKGLLANGSTGALEGRGIMNCRCGYFN